MVANKISKTKNVHRKPGTKIKKTGGGGRGRAAEIGRRELSNTVWRKNTRIWLVHEGDQQLKMILRFLVLITMKVEMPFNHINLGR